MADISDNSTASNYSIQPGSNHPPIPDPIDVRDHPARSMPDMDWGKDQGIDNSANVQMNTRVNAMREERAIKNTIPNSKWSK